MKYATYTNLQRAGYIIVRVKEGNIWDVWKPDPQNKWNGKVVVLDFDCADESSENYTELIDIDNSRKHCYFTEW